jgi:hypothetical protein
MTNRDRKRILFLESLRDFVEIAQWFLLHEFIQKELVFICESDDRNPSLARYTSLGSEKFSSEKMP